MKTKQDMIDNIMDNFDFNRVAKCMEVLEWKWYDVEGIPKEYDIRKFARKYLNKVDDKHNTERRSFGLGGFTVAAWYEEGTLDAIELSFVVTEWSEEIL